MQHLMHKPHVLKISVDALTKAGPFAAHQDIRYYINGIAVIPLASGGVLAAATNGHAIVCVRDPEGFASRTVILPITNKRNKPALKAHGTVRMTDEGAIFTEVGGEVRFIVPESQLDGKFPDIQKVFGNPEQYDPGIASPFALRYLKLIDGVGPYEYVRFWTRRDKGGLGQAAGVGMFTIGDRIFGGVMPLREDAPPAITSIIPAEVFTAPALATTTGEG
jgi:hypothetical protein